MFHMHMDKGLWASWNVIVLQNQLLKFATSKYQMITESNSMKYISFLLRAIDI